MYSRSNNNTFILGLIYLLRDCLINFPDFLNFEIVWRPTFTIEFYWSIIFLWINYAWSTSTKFWCWSWVWIYYDFPVVYDTNLLTGCVFWTFLWIPLICFFLLWWRIMSSCWYQHRWVIIGYINLARDDVDCFSTISFVCFTVYYLFLLEQRLNFLVVSFSIIYTHLYSRNQLSCSWIFCLCLVSYIILMGTFNEIIFEIVATVLLIPSYLASWTALVELLISCLNWFHSLMYFFHLICLLFRVIVVFQLVVMLSDSLNSSLFIYLFLIWLYCIPLSFYFLLLIYGKILRERWHDHPFHIRFQELFPIFVGLILLKYFYIWWGVIFYLLSLLVVIFSLRNVNWYFRMLDSIVVLFYVGWVIVVSWLEWLMDQ